MDHDIFGELDTAKQNGIATSDQSFCDGALIVSASTFVSNPPYWSPGDRLESIWVIHKPAFDVRIGADGHSILAKLLVHTIKNFVPPLGMALAIPVDCNHEQIRARVLIN